MMTTQDFDSSDLPFDYTDDETVMCRIFNDCKQAITELLGSGEYEKEYRYFIKVLEPRGDILRDDSFYTPLISIRLIESYGIFYFQYAVNLDASEQIDSRKITALIRCVYESSSKAKTLRDMEKYIEVHSHNWFSYERALASYRSGYEKYKPEEIPINKEEA